MVYSGALVLRYRDRSVSVQLALYCGTVCYCGTESGLLVCNWRCIVERCYCGTESGLSGQYYRGLV
jgi:hypothetical protein